jgi:hypothetical protein
LVEGKGRLAATEILTAEDACKWRKLNSLYGAEGWDDATAALSWDSAGIPEHIRRALDAAWRIEVARMARAHQEEQAELAREDSKRKRREQRRVTVRPVNQFIHAQGLSIVHDSAVPKPRDEVAAANPLSQQYAHRPRRKPRSLKPSPSPPPAELVAAAAEKGIAIVPAHKQTRQQAGGAAAEAEAALAALDPAVAAAIAAKFVAASSNPASATAVAPSLAQAQPSEAQQAELEQLASFYKKVKAYVNEKRETKQLGSLSKASRAALRDLCKYHYRDVGPREKGFEGTALRAPWHANYYDAIKHPASLNPDTDSD